jgi:predicted GIY-YIG superfamily endonuclease
MDDGDQLHALYRYRGDGKRQPPLYIGRTNNPIRRTEEHRRSKPWITETVRIDVERFSADAIAEAERQAIRREQPIYNIQHNDGRLRVGITAEVTLSPPSPESIAAMLAMILVAGMAAVWAFDFLANWNVKRRAERAGQQVELPPPRNLFTQDPQHWSARRLQSLVTLAAPTMGELEERELRRQEELDRLSELTQGVYKMGDAKAR